MTQQLPHAPYIEAVTDALTAAGLPPAEVDVRDDETRGTHCYLDAVVTLTPEASGIHAGRFEHGLILVWEWHTGLEEGGDERGPVWQWAWRNEDGSNQLPEWLPVAGYASPHSVVTAAQRVLADPRPYRAGERVNGVLWGRADELDAACEAWAAAETGE
ncbi:hypothetical protein ACFOOM_01195 [Streptomyces echinoruber]|uniref:Uncharacterized protein n=1 Tax=Streptomyces echinoruber TaxID=68898 RepID=A0A918V685_9ACTN|nr:hypothetical protein [Streptomyces echinoruber]GGZ72959.1 hypothetical protein GCM10010389_07940 [Streptomyces echinoruber]